MKFLNWIILGFMDFDFLKSILKIMKTFTNLDVAQALIYLKVLDYLKIKVFWK